MKTNLLSTAQKQHKGIKSNIILGNITPNWWYQKFTNKRGCPDLALISVLSEIIYWYRPKRIQNSKTGEFAYVNKFTGDSWQTSYEHFKKKFSFNREKLRRIFVKLEKLDICTREFRQVNFQGQTYNNRLFIQLNSNFLNSCIGYRGIVKLKQHDNSLKNTYLKREDSSPHFRGKQDIKNNLNKNRSMKSKNKGLIKQVTKTKLIRKSPQFKDLFDNKSLVNNQPNNFFTKTKRLKDFYPLSERDCYELQLSSGRKFSLNSMNEILLDMSKRLTSCHFLSKKYFLRYMSKAFFYEKRNPIKINHASFKIKNNLDSQKTNDEEREKYLTAIEENKYISPESRLRKRLVAKLSPEKAYDLLRAHRSTKIKGNVSYFYLSEYIEITNCERELILDELRFIYQDNTLLEPLDTKRIYIERLEIIMPAKNFSNAKVQKNKMEEITLPKGIWGTVRKKLIGIYGQATDHNWFSKLESYIDKTKQIIILKAPSKFIKDWIEQNYFCVIEKIIKDLQYHVSISSI